jgi:hypothetical protein
VGKGVGVKMKEGGGVEERKKGRREVHEEEERTEGHLVEYGRRGRPGAEGKEKARGSAAYPQEG